MWMMIGVPGPAAEVSLIEPWATGMESSSTDLSGLAGSVGSVGVSTTGRGFGGGACRWPKKLRPSLGAATAVDGTPVNRKSVTKQNADRAGLAFMGVSPPVYPSSKREFK